MQNDQPSGREIQIELPPAFFEECARRDIPPDYAAQHLMDVFVEVSNDAPSLIEDWHSAAAGERLRFALDQMKARFDLEHPRQDA